MTREQILDTRTFPIQMGESVLADEGGRYFEPPTRVPWWLAEIAYAAYSARYGDDQSLEELAERGGFGRKELVSLIQQAGEVS